MPYLQSASIRRSIVSESLMAYIICFHINGVCFSHKLHASSVAALHIYGSVKNNPFGMLRERAWD